VNRGIRDKGREGERRAEEHLSAMGWRCIGRNVLFRVGEIDLVFERETSGGCMLVLVEVRARSVGAMVSPGESIRGMKARRMFRAAEAFLARYRGRAREVRFDLVAVEGDQVKHYPDFLPWR
jgi:putative endonuclease